MDLARLDALAASLREALVRDIAYVRGMARGAGLGDLRRQFGMLPGATVGELMFDRNRAQDIATRTADFFERIADRPGAIGMLDRRLATIGVTENAGAFNQQRRDAMRIFAARLDTYEIWDATLDKRTCDHCAGLDGIRALVGVGFPGGVVPGIVHPRCRCTSHFEVR